ncbi:histidine phosphatase family protein, partial [Lactobacillus nasalidis]
MAKLALLRHGESQANAANVYTGWNDVPLTDKGRRQAWAAGEKLRQLADFSPERIHTS